MPTRSTETVIISDVIVLNITVNCLATAVIARYPALRKDRTRLFMFSLCMSLNKCALRIPRLSIGILFSARNASSRPFSQ